VNSDNSFEDYDDLPDDNISEIAVSRKDAQTEEYTKGVQW
jgi:hypothetical protein